MLIARNDLSFGAVIDERGRRVAAFSVDQGERFEAPNRATRGALLETGVAMDANDPEVRIFQKAIAERKAALANMSTYERQQFQNHVDSYARRRRIGL